jgi:hypothetical protein
VSERRASDLGEIGWREWVGLPQVGVVAIKAKVDTGARTSAMHAFDIEFFRKQGAPWARFVIHPLQRDTRTTVRATAPLVDERWVRSSSGQNELRPVIGTDVRIGDDVWPIEITLTNRDSMGFRMLLGRHAVRGRYLINPARSFLLGTAPAKRRARKAGRRKHGT